MVLIGARWFALDATDTRTLTFTTLVTTNLSLIFTNRSLTQTFLRGWRAPNPALWWLIAAALLILAAVLFVPVMRQVFQLARPRAIDLLICAVSAIVAIVWMELLKLVNLGRAVA